MLVTYSFFIMSSLPISDRIGYGRSEIEINLPTEDRSNTPRALHQHVYKIATTVDQNVLTGLLL